MSSISSISPTGSTSSSITTRYFNHSLFVGGRRRSQLRWSPPSPSTHTLPLSLVSPPQPSTITTSHIDQPTTTTTPTSTSSKDDEGEDIDMEGLPTNPLPRRVCFLVEPSPFTYVCGYMNRFRSTIKFLREAGCEVLIITPGKGVSVPGSDASAYIDQPEDFHGAKIISAMSFPCPWYWPLPLSFALSPRIYKYIKEFNPDIIHCSSPGVMVMAALVYSRLLKKALVYSYHTHVPEYMPNYGISFLINAMWAVIRFFHTAAHLTLVTSQQMATELTAQKAAPEESINVWKKGVCSDTFHPKNTCTEMRRRLSNGHPEAPLLLSVGRLGTEKNLDFIKGILERIPNARLAFVGDGPAREDLERHFAGTNTVFMGMLHGEDLSAAYASADVFVMPSTTETLGFVVLEAMAAGRPVVAVKAGGIPDILTREGETGYMYQPGDLDTATALVERLVGDDELRRRVGEAAREEVSKWDWRAATQYLLKEQYPLAMMAAAAYYYKKEDGERSSGSGEEGVEGGEYVLAGAAA